MNGDRKPAGVLVIRPPDEHEDYTPTPRAAGSGLMDGNRRRGPFGGTNRIASMMDEEDRPARSPKGRGRVISRAVGPFRAGVRGDRSQSPVWARSNHFCSN